MEKIKENHYYAPAATFTTCDSESAKEGRYEGSFRIFRAGSPDWCFKGNNVDILVGEKMTASNVTYRVKGLPVLYSPYLWAPVKTDRETGFLFPLIGNSTTKGFQFSPAFFWAIDENKDATFSIDYYSKRGIGKGIEYRYLDFNDKGKWYVYHLKDKELNKTFYELKGMHEHQLGDIRAFVDVNYVNEKDFYKEYAYNRNERIQRFLQSTGEISVPLRNSRLYLLGQHWIDLQNKDAHVPQRLPELGYVVNTTGIGPLMFSMSSNIANFSRKIEVSGKRIDINPTLSYSFGDWVQLFQSLSLRETAYNLKNGGTYGSAPHRETFEYRANALTRFLKRYESATHIIEPSLTYQFIPQTHPLPLFDSTESLGKVSLAQFSILNTLTLRNLSLSARLTQPYDFNAVTPAHSLQP
ncbi:MAG: LPS-assembly protein LptD, partial [Nitrospirae bacterium]|nr:LPS-assembly protein LptD [Nitrospirota bacterium]